MTELLWFRRDLRLHDHPALAAAAEAGDDVLALFVVDPALEHLAGTPRGDALRRTVLALDDALGGRLHVVHGAPHEVVPALARERGASRVHVTGDPGPYGSRRDARVADALGDAGAELVATGTGYAVSPGRLRNAEGEGYKVFSAFRRAWYAHGWPGPADTSADTARWREPGPGDRAGLDVLAGQQAPAGMDLPAVGEDAARQRWAEFLNEGLDGYATDRDRPDLDRTSRLGVHLKLGALHPRTLLADLAALGPSDALDERLRDGRDTYASELAWREFYADVLFHRPDTRTDSYDRRWTDFPWDSGPGADEAFEAWQEGRTGYPFVHAGMRQLRHEGWMHNRVRMVAASFLTKDLHVDWRRGARHFLDLLVDGDVASNQHGWQWTAGTGTDAAPYFRVFNPVTQGKRFDPEGDYVRRWVPELADVAGKAVHDPRDDGHGGYPAPIVDHAEERRESLDRYDATIRGAARD